MFSDEPGDLAANHVEAADDDHAGRVVDDHVDAGRLLERADVAALAADDPALHLVAGDVDRAGGRLGGVGGGKPLHRGQQHLPRLLLARLRDASLVLEDDRAGFLREFGFEVLQEPRGGLVAAQAAQFVQRLPLEVEQLGEFLLAAVGVLDSLGQLALRALDDLLLFLKLFGLLLQGVLAFVQDAFALVQFLAEFAEFLLAFGLLLDGHFLDFELGLALPTLGLLHRMVDDLSGLRLGVLAPKMVQRLDNHESHHGRQRGRNGNPDNVYWPRLVPSPISVRASVLTERPPHTGPATAGPSGG